MSDNRKEAEEKMAKAIFISGDGWLSVFDLLPPSQLGLGIALVSHRFDFYVDEHFKTRRWALIFQIYIDNSVIAFLRRFCPIVAAAVPINLVIDTDTDDDHRILALIMHRIWPLLGQNICGMEMSVKIFHRLRQFVPSMLTDCHPSLRVVTFNADNLFIEFPADDSAVASDGQAVAKWLFTTAHPNNVPKMLKCALDTTADGNLAARLEAFKAAFANASSPANFIAAIFSTTSFIISVEPFDLINELTREQLALKRTEHWCFLLIRCPIVRDASKWAKWEEEAAIGLNFNDQRNQIDIQIYDENEIGDGLLDATLDDQSDQ